MLKHKDDQNCFHMTFLFLSMLGLFLDYARDECNFVVGFALYVSLLYPGRIKCIVAKWMISH